MEEEIDLFEHYETLPQEVQDVLMKFGECEDYEQCDALLAELKPLGYEFDYGLAHEPYNLRKINLEVKD
jgi:hypothetical protein